MENAVPTACQCGTWTARENLQLAIDDLGTLQGAIAVDRLRTVRGLPWDADNHLARFRRSCELLQIRLDHAQVREAVHECVRRSSEHFGKYDFSIVMLATPGSAATGSPVWMVYSSPIDWPKLAAWYSLGQVLKVSTNANVPAACWSPSLKTRARIQYYLADRECASDSEDPYQGAILPSIDNCLTETSVGNLILAVDDHLLSPPADQVLDGLTLQTTCQLAEQAGFPVRRERITAAHTESATEILLTGSTGILWPAQRVEWEKYAIEHPLQSVNGPIYKALAQLWCERLGIDYVRTAREQVS